MCEVLDSILGICYICSLVYHVFVYILRLDHEVNNLSSLLYIKNSLLSKQQSVERIV